MIYTSILLRRERSNQPKLSKTATRVARADSVLLKWRQPKKRKRQLNNSMVKTSTVATWSSTKPARVKKAAEAVADAADVAAEAADAAVTAAEAAVVAAAAAEAAEAETIRAGNLKYKSEKVKR
jgi:hypothetical protein